MALHTPSCHSSPAKHVRTGMKGLDHICQWMNSSTQQPKPIKVLNLVLPRSGTLHFSSPRLPQLLCRHRSSCL